MSKCCNCSPMSGGYLNGTKLNLPDQCSYYLIQGEQDFTYTIPLSGMYVMFVSSKDEDISNLDLLTSTSDGVAIAYLNLKADTVISGSLGTTSNFKVLDYQFSTTASSSSGFNPVFYIQYLGAEVEYKDACNISGVPIWDAFKSRNQSYYRSAYSDGTTSLSLVQRDDVQTLQIPSCSWTVSSRGYYLYFIGEFTLEKETEVTFYMFGDEYAYFILDGILRMKSSPTASFTITLKAGTHQFIGYNKDIGGDIITYLIVGLDSDDNNIINYDNVQVLESSDCGFNITEDVTYEVDDTSEDVEFPYDTYFVNRSYHLRNAYNVTGGAINHRWIELKNTSYDSDPNRISVKAKIDAFKQSSDWKLHTSMRTYTVSELPVTYNYNSSRVLVDTTSEHIGWLVDYSMYIHAVGTDLTLSDVYFEHTNGTKVYITDLPRMKEIAGSWY